MFLDLVADDSCKSQEKLQNFPTGVDEVSKYYPSIIQRITVSTSEMHLDLS